MSLLSKSRSFQRAFTLIEMLVVMIIVAMVVTLVVQGFGYTLGLYQRVVKIQNSAYQQVFAYHWFTSSLQSQVAMRPKDRALEGDASQLSTYSYRPLLSGQGLKTLIRWELQTQNGDLLLNYSEGQAYFPVQRWPAATGEFEYLTDSGNWVKVWPAENDSTSPLPKALRLRVDSLGDSLNYLVKVETRQRAEVTMEEILYGRD
jgi:general secretion pathway protein J